MEYGVADAITYEQVDLACPPWPILVAHDSPECRSRVKTLGLEEHVDVFYCPAHKGLQGGPVYDIARGHVRNSADVKYFWTEVGLTDLRADEHDVRPVQDGVSADSWLGTAQGKTGDGRDFATAGGVAHGRSENFSGSGFLKEPARNRHVCRMHDHSHSDWGCRIGEQFRVYGQADRIDVARTPVPSLLPPQARGIGQLQLGSDAERVVSRCHRKFSKVVGGRIGFNLPSRNARLREWISRVTVRYWTQSLCSKLGNAQQQECCQCSKHPCKPAESVDN